jgi:hypothetical protein
MPANLAAHGAQKREPGLIAVSLRPCGPLALIPVNEKKNEIGGEFGPKNGCYARPWGRRAVILMNESCLLVDYAGQLASVLGDSAVCARK